MLHRTLIFDDGNGNKREFPIAVGQAGHGEPTAETPCCCGITYLDEDTGRMYRCIPDGNGGLMWDPVPCPDDIPTKISELENDSGFLTEAPVTSVNGQTGAVSIPIPESYTADGELSNESTNPVQNKAVTAAILSYGANILVLGATGDGVTDDTAAFVAALAENRHVYVPAGTYVLSDMITIAENCQLELSQGAVLKFTQTDKNCIAMQRLANLKGNHATIIVPYEFNAHVIHASTDCDVSGGDAVPPWTMWDPQWKMSRYVTDINICKPDSRGYHYSVDGNCYGTAVYIDCDRADMDQGFMWGVDMSGLRIAGGFSYGIRIHNEYDSAAGKYAWNHDMRIEAVIDACEVGVSCENCNNAHLAVTIQPRRAFNTSGTYTPYAKHGIKLSNSNSIDLTSSCVWDWTDTNTLKTSNSEYQHLAMYGTCKGVLLSDHMYNTESVDIRSLIYTDTQANFDSLIILQEPFTRWFKPIDHEPYFDNGSGPKRLMLQSDLDTYFDTERIQTFTDALASATDAYNSSNVFNGIGYMRSGYRIKTDGALEATGYYGCTGFIPCTKGDRLYLQDIVVSNDGWAIVVLYNSSGTKVTTIVGNNSDFLSGSQYYVSYTVTDDGCTLLLNDVPESNDVAYIRICTKSGDFGPQPVISVNNEIGYQQEGFLQESVKVKGESIILSSPGGKSYKLTVNNSGQLTATEIT